MWKKVFLTSMLMAGIFAVSQAEAQADHRFRGNRGWGNQGWGNRGSVFSLSIGSGGFGFGNGMNLGYGRGFGPSFGGPGYGRSFGGYGMYPVYQNRGFATYGYGMPRYSSYGYYGGPHCH